MSSTDAILAALDWNWHMVDTTLSGLDDAVLACRPKPECNSIAWTLWHMNRVLDTFIHRGIGSEVPLWLRDGWCEKYGMNDAPEDHGVGLERAKARCLGTPGKGRAGRVLRSSKEGSLRPHFGIKRGRAGSTESHPADIRAAQRGPSPWENHVGQHLTRWTDFVYPRPLSGHGMVSALRVKARQGGPTDRSVCFGGSVMRSSHRVRMQ